MSSSSAARVSMKARRAMDSRAAQLLARAGLTARGVIYIRTGIVAILVATGRGGRSGSTGWPRPAGAGSEPAGAR